MSCSFERKFLLAFSLVAALQPVISQFLNLPVFPPPLEINDVKQSYTHPRSISTQADINKLEETVKEVEAILRTNPALPRLTRGEILDLLDNITNSDLAKSLEQANAIRGFTKNDGRDPKAVMLVMPYTPENDNKHNMEELYTKPPVTHIVGSPENPKTENEIGNKAPTRGTSKIRTKEPTKVTREKITIYRGEPFRKNPTTTTTTTTSTTTSTTTERSYEPTQHYFVERPHHRRRRPTATTTTTTTTTTTELPLTTYSPVKRRPTRRRIPTTVRYSNHKYPEEEFSVGGYTEPPRREPTALPSDGLRIITPPRFEPSSINEDLLMSEDHRKDILEVNGFGSKEHVQQYNVDLVSQPATSFSVAIDPPERLKGVTSNANLDVPSSLPLKNKPATKIHPTKPEIDEANDESAKIRDLLLALGALPLKTTTTTTALPDIGHVADSLTPDMKELLMTFGLLPDPNQKPSQSPPTVSVDTYNPDKPVLNPDAYVGFKPLPEDDTNRNEMDELLARFGLGRNSKQGRRGIKREQKPEELKLEAVPEEYQGVLEDIGLSNRRGKEVRAEPLTKTQEKQHVFNPQDTQYATEEEMKKLNKLLDAIKRLEKLNRTATDEDLKEIDFGDLKELAANLNNEYNKMVPLNEQEAPNPLKFDNGLSKNEVKRQEDKESSTTTESTGTTLEEDKGPSIKDLEDSFGGPSETVVAETVVTEAAKEAEVETTTQARRTGFYYLLDWNTFLDIDDQKGKRVNLRFQPKAGDPKRFYSVSVP